MSLKLDNLDLAIQLALLGWYVFPQGQNKRPMVPSAHPEGDPLYKICRGECGKLGHGYHDAVTGFDAVMDLWERAGAPDTAIVGVACRKSGLLVVDVDHHREKDGPNGFDQLSEILAQNSETAVICGPSQNTAGGGLHMIFKMPSMPDDWSVPGKIAPGIDLKWNGYFCTGALLDGRTYQWLPGHDFDTPLTYPPTWLLRMIAKRNEPAERKPYQPTNASDDVLRAEKAIEKLDPNMGYDEWVKVGMSLRGLGNAGLALWHKWSGGSPKYKPAELDAKWKTFDETGIHLGSLFFWAKQSGA